MAADVLAQISRLKQRFFF